MILPKIRVLYFDLGNTLITGDREWVPGAQAALEALRDAGIELGILSNTGDLSRSRILDLLPVDFDLSVFADQRVLFSSEHAGEKPDAGFFGLAVDRAEVPAAEVAFCGERLSETLAAQASGMCGIRISVRLDASGSVTASDIESLAEQIAAFGPG